MRPSFRSILLYLAMASGLAACDESRDPATPEGALHLLRDTLLARDAPGLLAQSSAATHTQLAELHRLAQAQAAHVARDYPAEHKSAAQGAYPAGVLEAADPPALFAALVGPQLAQLEASPGLSWGLTSLGVPAIDGDRASVSTQSGETLEFVRENDVWKTTAFESHLQANVNRLKLNQQTFDENLNIFKELARRAAEKAATAAASAPSSGSAPASAAAPSQSP